MLEIVTEIVLDFSDRAMPVLKNSDRNRQEPIVERTRGYFNVYPVPLR